MRLTRLERGRVRDLDMLAEGAGRVEGAWAVGTLGRVGGFDVGLEEGVGGEGDAGDGSGCCFGERGGRGQRCFGGGRSGGGGGAESAHVAAAAVYTAFVRAQGALGVVGVPAGLACCGVDEGARESFLVQVGARDVLLESGMLAEGGVAGRVGPAAVLLFSLMRGHMASEAGAARETFAAARPGADVVALRGMRGLDVAFEVVVADEGLGALLAGEGTAPRVG